jgi:gas vesicle protein
MISMKNTKELFISFLVGGALGGAIALLFAPKQGKQLRNDISRKTNELFEEGRKKTADLLSGAGSMAESTLDSANDFLNTGMEKLARKTEKAKNVLKSVLNDSDEERKSGNNSGVSLMENAEDIRNQRT